MRIRKFGNVLMFWVCVITACGLVSSVTLFHMYLFVISVCIFELLKFEETSGHCTGTNNGCLTYSELWRELFTSSHTAVACTEELLFMHEVMLNVRC